MKLVPFQKCACGAKVVHMFPVATLTALSAHSVVEYRTVTEASDGRGQTIVHSVSDCVLYRQVCAKTDNGRFNRHIDRTESIVTGQVEELSHD